MCVKLFLGSQVVGLVLYMRVWCCSVTLNTELWGCVSMCHLLWYNFYHFFNRVNHYVTSDIIFGLVGLVQQLTSRSVKFNISNFLIIYLCRCIFGCFLIKIFIKTYFKAPLLQSSMFRRKSLVIAFCITSRFCSILPWVLRNYFL